MINAGVGVLVGGEVTAQASPDTTVNVSAVQTSHPATTSPIAAPDTLTIATADATQDRIDVVVQADDGTVSVITGPVNDGSNAQPPDTTGYVELAHIYVINQAAADYTGTITDDVITDVREQVMLPTNDARFYGAIGDNDTINTTMIQAAIDAVAAAGGGTVLLPAGVYLIDDQLVLPNRVQISGDGERATGIVADASFPTDTAMVRLGDNTAIVYDCRVENLYLDCNDISGSIGVYTNEAEELTGVFYCLIQRYRAYGIQFAYTDASHNCQNCGAAHLELLPSNSNSTAGVSFVGFGHCFLDDISIVPYSAGTHTDGIYVDNTNGIQISNIHTDGHTDGIHVDATSNAFIHDVSAGTTGTNVVHLGSGTDDMVVVNVTKGGYTNSLLDDQNAITWTDATIRVFTTREMILGQCRINTNTGTPEGAVTARVGSLFLRSDGGANTTLYVKESGTGATGWIAK